MALVVNLQAIPNEETPVRAQPTEEIPIAKAENTFETKMDNMMKAFEALTIHLRKVNGPRYGGYQTARAYAIQADHPPPQTPMNYPLLNAPTGHTYYRPGPKSEKYPPQGLRPHMNCDELRHIRKFCPNVRANQDKGIVHLNAHGRLTLGPRGGHGGEISRYQMERRFVPMREYAREVGRQGQQGRGVATTAAPQPPRPQHIASSQLFQRASAQLTVFRSGIAHQLSEIDGYYSGQSTGKEDLEEGNEDHIEKWSDEDEEQEEGQGDSSAEEEEESETEEERDARFHREREKKCRQLGIRRQDMPSWMRDGRGRNR
jgi:hypothetical protein